MKEIEELMKKARRYLKGAERDFNEGDYFLSVSRCYYSMFTAARALLLKKGIALKTHKGTIKKFGEEYIKSGIFPKEYATALGRAMELREKSDYGISMGIIPRWRAEKTLQDAKNFLEEAEKYLEREKEKEKKQERGKEESEEEEEEMEIGA